MLKKERRVTDRITRIKFIRKILTKNFGVLVAVELRIPIDIVAKGEGINSMGLTTDKGREERSAFGE